MGVLCHLHLRLRSDLGLALRLGDEVGGTTPATGPARKTERARLQADHDRALRVLDAIDTASPGTDDQEQHADHR